MSAGENMELAWDRRTNSTRCCFYCISCEMAAEERLTPQTGRTTFAGVIFCS